jgi:hypothetical protein
MSTYFNQTQNLFNHSVAERIQQLENKVKELEALKEKQSQLNRKPDIVTYLTVALGHTGQQTTKQYPSDNLKFTYDSETGKLKSAEVI